MKTENPITVKVIKSGIYWEVVFKDAVVFRTTVKLQATAKAAELAWKEEECQVIIYCHENKIQEIRNYPSKKSSRLLLEGNHMV